MFTHAVQWNRNSSTDINEGESGFSAKGTSIRYGLTAIRMLVALLTA